MNKHRVCVLLALLLFLYSCNQIWEGSAMKLQRSQMLYPVVRVECKDGSMGSGVVVESSKGLSHILTAKHVLNLKSMKCRVTFYPDEITHPAYVVKVDVDYDLALLQVETEHPYVATLPDKLEFKVASPVWKSGGGGGHIPHLTKGILGENDEELLMATSPVTQGDSGGGLFTLYKREYVLIGIVVAHAISNDGQYVQHIGYGHNLTAVYHFLSP